MPDIPRQTAPPSPGTSSPTKHLIAGAYLDRDFRDNVLNRILHRPDRALAPDPGVDTALVLHHANASWSLDVAQHALASTIVCFIVMTSLSGLTLPTIVTLIAWALIGLAFKGSAAADSRKQPNVLALMVGGAVVLGLFAFAGPLIDAVLIAEGGTATVAERRTGLLWFWLILLAITAVGFGVARAARLNAVGENQSVQLMDERLQRISRLQGQGDVVNYSAHRSPFVGAGRQIATWQFAMPLRPDRKQSAADGEDPVWPHFSSADLNGHVKKAITALAQDRGHSRHLPGLELTDRFYVSGQDTDAPAHRLSDLRAAGLPSTAAQIQADPTGPVRHYLCCQAASWDGELVTSIFIHTALQGETLYMEFHSYLLPPTRESYHVFGRGAPDPEARLAFAGFTSFAAAPLLLVTGPLGLVQAARDGIANRRERRNGEDVGARTSVRELGSDLGPHSYFQGRDSVKYTEILEAQLLEAVLEFLDGKVDTSRLSGFTETIVNHGIINYGNAGAIGAGASATVGSVGSGSRGSVAK